MFEKILSRVGIGAATVDTILTNAGVIRGDMLRGEIRITGGKAAQEINRIELELMTFYKQDSQTASASYPLSLKHLSLAEQFVLAEGESKVIAFEMLVPIQAPVSQGPTKTWLHTDLDVPWAMDPKDNDPITLLPDQATARVLQALLDLGYHHTENSGTYLAMPSDFDLPFMQAFEFTCEQPAPGLPSELVAMIQANGYDAEIHLNLDPKAPEGAPDQPGRRVRFRLRHEMAFEVSDLQKHLLV